MPAEYRSLVGSYFEQTVADAYEVYERELVRFNAMDFDDLLVAGRQPARAVPGGARALPDDVSPDSRRRVPGQRTTLNNWLRLLAASRAQPCVVGDDAQSITASAAPTIATSSTSSATFPDAHIVKLEQNFRSTQTILSAANAVIGKTATRCARTSGPRLARAIRSRSSALPTARRGALHPGGIGTARRGGRLARGDRGLLPTNGSVTSARGRAGTGEVPYQVIGRHEVLRASRGQGCNGLPGAARKPPGSR